MELIIVSTLSISLSILLMQPCVSQQIQVQPSHGQDRDLQISHLTLSRKLRLLIEDDAASTTVGLVKVNGGEELLSNNNNKQREAAISGKQQHHEEERGGGTWQEWVEQPDRSEFFTMDYAHVRRRRPVNNKSVSVVP